MSIYSRAEQLVDREYPGCISGSTPSIIIPCSDRKLGPLFGGLEIALRRGPEGVALLSKPFPAPEITGKNPGCTIFEPSYQFTPDGQLTTPTGQLLNKVLSKKISEALGIIGRRINQKEEPRQAKLSKFLSKLSMAPH